MSTDFVAVPDIQFDRILDGSLEKYSVYAVIKPGTTGLRGPDGFVHVSRSHDGGCDFTIYRPGRPGHSIIDAIKNVFRVEIISEDDPRYYGCETWEELERLMKEHECSAASERRPNERRPTIDDGDVPF